jgi:hypothetical protein
MIRHLVLMKMRADVTDADRNSLWADLMALRSKVNGFLNGAFGPNVSPEAFDRGYTHVFTMDFETSKARDAYLDHPDHKVAGGRLVAMLTGGTDGLLVLDFEVQRSDSVRLR